MANEDSVRLQDVVNRCGEPVWRRVDRRLTGLVLLAFVWSFIGHIDQVVTATGKVIPYDKVKVIQHLEGGIVKHLLVRENVEVKAGDPLIELDLATSGINKSEMSVRLAALEFARARLLAESKGHEPQFPKALAEQFPDIVQAEWATYRARRDEFMGAQDAISGMVTQNRSRTAELEAKMATLQESLKLARQELAISEDLMRDKLTSQLEHFQRKNNVERLQGEIQMTRQAIPGSAAATAESRARQREDEARFRRRATDELVEVEGKIGSLREELGRATDQAERAVVRSPIDGVVKNLRVQATGNVVRPGEPLMEVVPLKEELMIEVNLSPADRGYVRLDQPALVKISTYDFFRYGGLSGRVTGIAADADLNHDNVPFFKVVVKTEKSWLGSHSEDLPISPGMQAEVDIHVDSRSIFWILLRPVLKLRHEAFREI